MEKDNTTSVLTQFIRKLGIPVTRQSISDELQKHPNYNSLLAISDVLNNWRVPNAAYDLKFDKLLTSKMPDVFIAVSKKEFVVVSHLDDNYAIVSNEKWNNHRLTIEEFKKIYSGSVLVAEKDAESGDQDYPAKYREQIIEDLRLPVIIISGVAVLLMLLLLHSDYISNFNWQIGLLTVFKTAGLLTSILLLIQSIDSNNPLIQKLCGTDGNKNCNAILSSDAAKINKQLSWSEVGFFYFAGTWLVLLFNSGHTSIIQTLALLNLLSLPYTVYSIYHQWRVAKQWCILCCTVQALLWFEFFSFIPALMQPTKIANLTEWTSIIIGLSIPVIAWMFIKPYLLLSEQTAPLKSQLRTFKYNSELFEKLLDEGVKYGLPADEHCLVIGNREAENIITMVSNPFCQPCAKAHKGLVWLNDRDDVKFQLIFADATEEDSSRVKIATHMLSLQQNENDKPLKIALDDWYSQKQKDYDAWAKRYPLSKLISADEALKKQQEWCDMAEVTSTPTLFINGRKLPQNYQPEDLKYFI